MAASLGNAETHRSQYGEAFATDPVTEKAIIALKTDQAKLQTKPDSAQQEKIHDDMKALAAKTEKRAAEQPGNLAVQHSAARFALQQGDNAKALALADKTVALAQAGGDERVVRRTLLTRSMTRAAGKDYAGACEDAQRVLKDEPQNATAVEMRLFNCERPQKAPSLEASDTFRWLAQQSPEVPHTPEQWARRQKEHPTASFGPVSASMQALQASDLAGALRRAEEAVAADGNDPMAWAQRGLARVRLDDNDGAIPDLSRAIAMGMVWNVLYRLRAEALIKAKRYAAAIGDASIAVSLDPKDASAYAARAAAKMGAGLSADQILADFDAAARLDPARYQTAFERAKADLATGAAAARAPRSDGGDALTDEQRAALGRALSADLPVETGTAAWTWVAAASGLGLLLLVGLTLLRRRRPGSGLPPN